MVLILYLVEKYHSRFYFILPLAQLFWWFRECSRSNFSSHHHFIIIYRATLWYSATAQFFINVNDNDFLNHTAPNAQGWGYAVFGKVTDGLDVVDVIRKVKTGNSGFHQDVPAEDVVIEKATVLE